MMSPTVHNAYSAAGAPTGHTSAQAPQSMHFSASITNLPSPSEIASTGQPSAQAPQAIPFVSPKRLLLCPGAPRRPIPARDGAVPFQYRVFFAPAQADFVDRKFFCALCPEIPAAEPFRTGEKNNVRTACAALRETAPIPLTRRTNRGIVGKGQTLAALCLTVKG